MYRSTDAGKSWTRVGLGESLYIGKVVIHPRDPNRVFVAAMGQMYGAEGNEERGVFRTTDGGSTWEKVLYVDRLTGAVDLSMDPENPNRMFASMWQVYRTPWALESGGPGSGLYRTTDGGGTWTRLEKGLPAGHMGKIGVAVSPAEPKRVYAVIEAVEHERGMYRSNDGGDTWTHVSSDHELVQRPWYYMHVTADPKDPDLVYVPSLFLMKSGDGGSTWEPVPQYHPDNHALWIDPNDPKRMINANDGGANITVNAGQTWSRSDNNQPTGQFYHITTDNDFPYRIYGSMQDFTTIAIDSLSNTGQITESNMEIVGGCQGGFVAPHPSDPNIVYHGCTDGWLMRLDRRIGLVQRIDPWPETNLGLGADVAKYRFNWTSPLMTSHHDPERLYFAANVVFKSTDRGQSWNVISPDLSRDDKTKQGPAGGDLTRESIGIEYYDLIFALAESPVEAGVLWAGSDDGLVHVTRDEGKSWNNVTPDSLPDWSRVSWIEPSPHDAARAYVAVDRHQLNDYGPHLFRTTDFGQTWTTIADGIPIDTYVRVVREDTVRQGLLYAGTETGMVVSFDDGESWDRFQLNMPVSPVHDLVVKNDDLIVGTHGRAIWSLDDLSPLRQWNEEVSSATSHLFVPETTYRVRTDHPYDTMKAPSAENPATGAVICYKLGVEAEGDIELSILDSKGERIRTFTGEKDGLSADRGLHRFVWDLRYPGARRVEDAYIYGSLAGPTALPGVYKVALMVAGRTQTAPLVLEADPRVEATLEDLAAQFDLQMEVRNSLSTLAGITNRVRDIRKQLQDLEEEMGLSLEGEISIPQMIRDLHQKLDSIEGTLTQTQARTFADTFHYGLRLDGKLGSLLDVVGDGAPSLFGGAPAKPTNQAHEVHGVLWGPVEAEMDRLNTIIEKDVQAVNSIAREKKLPTVDAGPVITRAK
jgi:photosystem II stability/assembly factor-like uncharacterized protein